MSFFFLLNPKRQQAAWYDEPLEKLGTEKRELVDVEAILEPEPQPLNLDNFLDSFENEEDRIEFIAKRRKKRNNAIIIQYFMDD